jgi:hypothetical protein
MTGQGWLVDHNTVAVSPCSGSRALPLVLSGIGSKIRCFRNSFPDARLKIPCSVLGDAYDGREKTAEFHL